MRVVKMRKVNIGNQMPFVDIEIVKPMGRFPIAGKIISVETDSDGVILDRFLRRRLKDSEIDGCLRIVPAKKSKEDKVNGKSVAN